MPNRQVKREPSPVRIRESLQTVALSDQDTEKVLFELDKDEQLAQQHAEITVQNLKQEVAQIESQLEKLLDAYLAQVITAEEYGARKSKLLTQKLDLNEQIANITERGASWLELAREFVLNLNQAENLRKTEDFTTFPTFLKKIGSNHVLRRGRWDFAWDPTYQLAVQPAAAGSKNLTFPTWCPGRESNSHAFWAIDLKSIASAIPPPGPILNQNFKQVIA